MPSATFDKLNQLKAQLGQCNNETAALLLQRTIAKLESQLYIEQLTTQSTQDSLKASPETSETITKHQSPDQNQVQGNPKATLQERSTKSSLTKGKDKPWDYRNHKRRLLPGNGTHRAWCRLRGTIRVQEAETEGERSQYFLEIDGHQLSLRVKNRFSKSIGAFLDKPLMVKCYPHIIEGKIVFLQFCGTVELTPEYPENWVMIGVWNAGKQRVMVQRDERCDPSRRILQHSPLVKEGCLEKLEGGKLYRFECEREGIMVTIVSAEAFENQG